MNKDQIDIEKKPSTQENRETDLIQKVSQNWSISVQTMNNEPVIQKIKPQFDQELFDEHSHRLNEETERLLREKRETERLSTSIEPHVIQEAKVTKKF